MSYSDENTQSNSGRTSNLRTINATQRFFAADEKVQAMQEVQQKAQETHDQTLALMRQREQLEQKMQQGIAENSRVRIGMRRGSF